MISYVNSKLFRLLSHDGEVIIYNYFITFAKQQQKVMYKALSEICWKMGYGLHRYFPGNEELNNSCKMSLSFNISGNSVSAQRQIFAIVCVVIFRAALIDVYYLNQPALRLL